MLELKDISYEVKFGGPRQIILDHISLQIKPGSFTVITGQNGSGKSTLAEIIMGIKTPTSGQIFWQGEDITKLPVTDRAKKGIAFSFQEPVKFKGITVYDLLNTASGELISKKEAGDYLKIVGLAPEDYLLREVNSKLSGGELKRIEIASVLRRNADLTIFDEPEAGIDFWSFDNLTKIFKMAKKNAHTTIVISHQERILKIADEIIVLSHGKIASCGTPDQLLPQIVKGEL